MKTISLTQSQFALVDDEDFEKLNQWKWFAHKNRYGGYAAVRTCHCPLVKQQHLIWMPRQILSCPQDKDTDYKNHNILNNQRHNLRICTNGENQRNKNRYKNNMSGYKGVSCFTKSKKWAARIRFNRELIYLGRFDSALEAAFAYDCKAKELFGEFACTNF